MYIMDNKDLIHLFDPNYFLYLLTRHRRELHYQYMDMQFMGKCK